MNKKWYPCELHCHTLHSDGDFTVDELVKAMKDKIDENYTYIFFNSGDYKCKLGMEYEYLEIMINIE